MEKIHRLSMNTSLKNARIFDDDAWDEHNCPRIKKEIKQEPSEVHVDHKFQTASIKREPQDDDDGVDTSDEDETKHFHKKSIKKEVSECTMREKGLEGSICIANIKREKDECETVKVKCKTPSPPPPPKITLEKDATAVDRMFDESPYNKAMFKTLKIKEETPVKTDIDEQQPGYSRNSLKSAKRTVFNRLSPYKKFDNDFPERTVSVKSRLGPKVDEAEEEEDGEEEASNHRPRPLKRSRPEMERDPAVLARREKQIEYGKNTIGYENYIKMVPRSERKLEDPKTPPKFGKYSRRGWEGLIKQWRIKLHKFDPV